MHVYQGADWAEWFDAYFGTYNDDFDFFLQLAREADGPVLEAGCGTGRLLLPMLQEGVDAHGFELSADLLGRLRSRAEELGVDGSRAKSASLFDFRYKHKFDKVFLAFRTFNHCPDIDSQIACLKSCYRALRPGGQLVLATYIPHPDLIVNADNAIRATGAVVDPRNGRPIMISHYVADIDSLAQIRTDVWILEELDPAPGCAPRRVFLPVTIRWVNVPEVSLLLRLAGFQSVEVFGGFEYEPLESGCDEQIWFATREK